MKVIVSGVGGVGTGVQPSGVSFIITSLTRVLCVCVCLFEKPNPALCKLFGLIPPSCVGPGVIVIFYIYYL